MKRCSKCGKTTRQGYPALDGQFICQGCTGYNICKACKRVLDRTPTAEYCSSCKKDVLRFNRMISSHKIRARKLRRRIVKHISYLEWRAIRDESPICPLCKQKVGCKKMSMDLKIPLTEGGKPIVSNIQAICSSCNKRKYNYTEKNPNREPEIVSLIQKGVGHQKIVNKFGLDPGRYIGILKRNGIPTDGLPTIKPARSGSRSQKSSPKRAKKKVD